MNILTLDMDWAPDFMMEEIADILIERKIAATWFVTHSSPILKKLRKHADLFELGIHPNFLSGSTHGAEAKTVLSHCLKMVPEARSMRSHGLFQSTSLLRLVTVQTPIRVDLSVYLPGMAGIHPVVYRMNGKCLWRIPFFWEDDFEMMQSRPRWDYRLIVGENRSVGLRIFNFHPVHIYLNSTGMESYNKIKKYLSRLTPQSRILKKAVWEGKGTRTFFTELVARLSAEGNSLRVCDLIKKDLLK